MPRLLGFLLAAGAVMIIAMATSKKAQNVIKTSVDLSRQDEGDEMFGEFFCSPRDCTQLPGYRFMVEAVCKGADELDQQPFRQRMMFELEESAAF